MVLNFKNLDYSNWSKTWKRSKQPRKQRKYILNAPLHIRRKIMSGMLCKEIRELVKVRSFPIRVGDYVKILRGRFKGIEGLVIKMDAKRYRVFVENAKFTAKTGKEVYYPIHHSKIMILRLNLSDKKRIEILKRRAKDKEKIEEVVKRFSTSEEEVKKAIELGRSI